MSSHIAEESSRWRGSVLMAADTLIQLVKQDRSFKTRVASVSLALLLGVMLGALVTYVPPLYLFVGIAGGVFAFLLLFKIEIAVMLAILLYNWLNRYNYLGGDTPMHPNGVIGVAIIAGAVLFFLRNRTHLSRLRVFWPFLAFSVIALVSLLWAGEYRMHGLTVALRLLTALAIYAVLVYKLDSAKMINWVIFAVLAGQVLDTVEGLIRVAQGSGMDVVGGAEIVRIGDSGVGARLAYIVAFCLVQLLRADTTRRRLLWGFWTGLFSLGLFFSYGRAGWIGFAIAVILIGLIRYRKLLLLFPVVLILMITLLPTVSLRFSEIDLQHLDDRSSSTIAGRIQVWRAGIEVYKSHPLVGVGYGVERYRIGEYLNQYPWMAHSDYLAVLVGTGLVGLVLFMFWHGQWLVELFQIYRRAVSPYAKTIALGVFAAFAASLVVRITDNVVQTMDKMLPLVALVAAAVALPRTEADMKAQSLWLDLSKGRPDDWPNWVLWPQAPTSSQLPRGYLQQRLPSARKTLASAAAARRMEHTRGVVRQSAALAEVAIAGQKQGDTSAVASVATGQTELNAPTLAALSMPEQKQQDILTVARGGGIAFAGETATRVIHWVYSTALIWRLGTEGYGMFTLALTVTSFVAVAASLGLPLGIVRFGAINARDEGLDGIHRATMAGLRIALPVALVITLGLLWSADLIAVSIFKKPELAPLIRALGLSQPFMSLQGSLLAGTRAGRIMRYSVIVLIVQPLAALLLAISLLALGYGVRAVVVAYVISHALGAALALYYYLRLIPRKHRTRERFPLKQMFKFSIPLALNDLINYTNQRTEVFFLGLLPGATSVGIYNIAWSISATESMLVQGLSAIISPFTSDLSHRRAISQLESLYKTTAKWAFTGALMAFLVFLFSAPTIMNVFDPAYVAGAGVLIALGFARLLCTTTGSAGTVLIMSGRSDLSLLNTIIVFPTSIGLDWLLIPRYGLPGAALAGALTVALADLLRVIEVWLTLKIHPFTWSFVKPAIAGLSGLAVVYALRAAVGVTSLRTDMVYWAIFAAIYLTVTYLLKLDAEDRLVLSALRRKMGAFRVTRQGIDS